MTEEQKKEEQRREEIRREEQKRLEKQKLERKREALEDAKRKVIKDFDMLALIYLESKKESRKTGRSERSIVRTLGEIQKMKETTRGFEVLDERTERD